MPLQNTHRPAYRLFGRSQDRPLTDNQLRLMCDLLPQIAIEQRHLERDILDKIMSGGEREAWLEIGFGGGEHLAWHAAANPDIQFIGAEPFINGVAKLLTQIEGRSLDNIRILHGDVRPFLDKLPACSLSRVFILHPDPWPKKRHQKRRIVNETVLHALARGMVPGAELRIASDIPDYIRWVFLQIRLHNARVGRRDFMWAADAPSDWQKCRADWPQTRYEAKAIREGRKPTYLQFFRR